MSESLAEKIWNHVKTLPEPLQSVLKRRLQSDEISTPVREIAKRFNLSEEESNAFETEATFAVVGLTDPATFKDDLIAEVGLNYETAVRVQRAFESEVLLPISSEVESTTGPAQEVTQTQVSPEIEAAPLYQDAFCRVTYSTLNARGNTYPIRQIAAISNPLQLPMELGGGLLLNAGLLAVGFLGLVGVVPIGPFFGFIAAAIGGFNVYGQFNRPWWITISLMNGEDFRIERKKKAEIQGIHSALSKALSR